MALVTFDNVSKFFGEVVAVRDFSLDIYDREFIVLLGPSGCGKSTALRIVAGLETPTRGNILIKDQVVNDVEPMYRDIAMVFQNYALYPHMTVYDNIAFGLRMRGLHRREIDRLVKEAAQNLGLGDLLRRKPGELSGGQRQRVALGRAIVRRPVVYLMDEPLSNLDAKLRVQTRGELVKMHRLLETTFIYVTHDQVEAMTMGDRIAIMEQGVLQQVGPPQEVYDRPANVFVAGFIGSPAMNMFPARLETRDGELFASSEVGSFRLSPQQADGARNASGGEIWVGVRPEHLYVTGSEGSGAVSATLGAVADLVEYLGNEAHVTFSIGDATVVARLEARVRITPGETVHLNVPIENLHLFDRVGGQRLA
ncbi:MAG: ABC transporter ATP-binding protein [Dehalococcoidia bacterium]|nr:ABC transporter ATP-binding protein [Dehalococcoidia bacterium]